MMAAEYDDRRADAESCPLCGEDVVSGAVRADSGVEWVPHQAHALCALEDLAARVIALEMDHEHFSAECACGARIFSWPGGYIAYEPPVLPPHPR